MMIAVYFEKAMNLVASWNIADGILAADRGGTATRG